MTLDEYVGRYRLLQHSTEKAQRRLDMYYTGAYQDFLRCFETSNNPTLSPVILSPDELRRDLRKKQRLCERYAVRLTRAISLMEPGEARDYALQYYLYGLTHEQIADQSFFCVRTVYRYARIARKALAAALLRVMPKVVKTEPCRYRVKGTLPRKKRDADEVSRALSSCYALRRRDHFNRLSIFA